MTSTAVTQRTWWPASAAAVIGAAALGLTLLVPRLFSDPVGVDPYVLRLSAVATALAAASLLTPRFAPTRPVLLAVAAMTLAFSVFAGGPQWIYDISGNRFDFNTQVLFASAAEALLTAVVALIAVRVSPPDLSPLLRLRRFGSPAAIATVLGIAAFLLVVLLLPATLLGREGHRPGGAGPRPAPAGPGVRPPVVCPGAAVPRHPPRRPRPRRPCLGGQPGPGGLLRAGPHRRPVPGAGRRVRAGDHRARACALGWVTQRTGSLWPAIIIHAVADIAVTVGVIPGLYGY